MIIRTLFYYTALSYLAIPCLYAKPVSLNALIEAEERQKALTTTPRVESDTSDRFSIKKIVKPKSLKPKKFKRKTGLFTPSLFLRKDPKDEKSQKVEKTTRSAAISDTSERFSLNKLLRPNSRKSKRLKYREKIFPEGKRVSALQNKKTFQIKSPLKQKELKYTQKRGHRRINQPTEGEIADDNEELNRKYIPLLRSLSMLFDNMLHAESGDSLEIARDYFGRHSSRNSTKRNTCTCHASDTGVAESAPAKATIVTTTALDEITTTEPTRPEATSTRAYHTPDGDFSSIGRDSHVPSLPAGDTAGSRRDYNGVRPRSRPTLHTSDEGNISGDNRNSEYDTRSGEIDAHTAGDKEDTYSPPRDDASSTRLRGRGSRGDAADFERPVYRGGLDISNYSAESEKGIRNTRRDIVKPKRKDQFEDRGDETESSEFVPEFVRGDRGFVPEDSVSYNPEPLQPQENYEEGSKSVGLDVSSNQRFFVGNGPSSTEDQKTNETNTAMISIDDLNNNPFKNVQKSPKQKAPFVTIFDGYSVARDKNGRNKLSEHSIRVHT